MVYMMGYVISLESIMNVVIVSILLILTIIVFRIMFDGFLSRHKFLNFFMMILSWLIVLLDVIIFLFFYN